jgi:hypothetical protein
MSDKSDEDDLRPEYDFDFSKGVRGKYYIPQPPELTDIPETDFTNAIRGRSNVALRRGVLRVSIDPDVARYYASDEAVNDALRMLIAEGRAPERPNE